MPRSFEWAEESSVSRALEKALRGTDDGELYIQHTQFEQLLFTDGRLISSTLNSDTGFGLRAVCGEHVGYAHSSELSDSALQEAVAATSIAKRGYTGHWDVSPGGSGQKLYDGSNSIELVAFETKVKLLEDVNRYARGKDPRVVQVSASLSASWSQVEILRPGGERHHDVRPMVQFYVNVVASENGRTESGNSGAGGRMPLEVFLDDAWWQRHVDAAVRMAAVNLKSKPAPAGILDIVLGPGLPGVMIHEAVGHGLEGDAIRKETSAFHGKLGEQVAAKGVTIVDNGSIEKQRGSLAIDDEGAATGRTVLIDDGVLVAFMMDRQSARLMDVTSTGNGRRQSYQHRPMPRMTNTYLESGDSKPADILSSLEDGIYAVNFGGGSVDTASGDFVFSCTEAYRVRNGQVEEPIKGATLVGNGPEAMQRVSMIGNDLALDEGVGVCSKAGQNVPVCLGQPTLRLDKVTVGGTQ